MALFLLGWVKEYEDIVDLASFPEKNEFTKPSLTQVCTCLIADLMRLMSFHRLYFASNYKIALHYYFSFVLSIPSNVFVSPWKCPLLGACGGWGRVGTRLWFSTDPCVSVSGTITTPSGGDPMNSGPKITTSRISDGCLITALLWATMARDPQTITALSTQTNWGSINSPCPPCIPQSQILDRPLLRNLLTIPSHPWIIGLLWRDH